MSTFFFCLVCGHRKQTKNNNSTSICRTLYWAGSGLKCCFINSNFTHGQNWTPETAQLNPPPLFQQNLQAHKGSRRFELSWRPPFPNGPYAKSLHFYWGSHLRLRYSVCLISYLWLKLFLLSYPVKPLTGSCELEPITIPTGKISSFLYMPEAPSTITLLVFVSAPKCRDTVLAA